jgi:hypothetical protein
MKWKKGVKCIFIISHENENKNTQRKFIVAGINRV